jgi:hypothetical protein
MNFYFKSGHLLEGKIIVLIQVLEKQLHKESDY